MPSPSSKITESGENRSHEIYMLRCLDLAALGEGNTAPNPLVGAVLVYEERIIGEGYHEKYGAAHAEVNCLLSVSEKDRSLIPMSTLYVSLEPCCHYGKTPPCTDLIIRENIPRVVIGCRDPFPAVDGKGIEKLIKHGVKVDYPVCEQLAMERNRRFFTFHQKKRPYIILKWAQSANEKMAVKTGEKINISNIYSNRLVHKWRSEEAAILVGTNTALLDNPQLTTRLWQGRNPVRIVLDQKLRLPDSLTLFDGSTETVILNSISDLRAGNRLFKRTEEGRFDISSILTTIYSLNIISVLVEGGSKLLQSFLDEGTWDEIRIITNREMEIPDGLSSPVFRSGKLMKTDTFGSDQIAYYINTHETPA